jgi:hypothetical protein
MANLTNRSENDARKATHARGDGERRANPDMAKGQSDTYGRDWAILSKIKPGDRLFTDSGFTCMGAGEAKIVRRDDQGRLFVPCRDGRHYLDGQRGENGALVGLYTRLHR